MLVTFTYSVLPQTLVRRLSLIDRCLVAQVHRTCLAWYDVPQLSSFLVQAALLRLKLFAQRLAPRCTRLRCSEQLLRTPAWRRSSQLKRWLSTRRKAGVKGTGDAATHGGRQRLLCAQWFCCFCFPFLGGGLCFLRNGDPEHGCF